MPIHRSLLVLSFAASIPAAALPAQNIDAGTFIIVRGSAEAGREEFAIREAAGRGARGAERNLILVSTSRLPGKETQVALEVSGDQSPVSLQQTESTAGRVARRVNAQIAGNRFSARLTSNEGESAREFAVRPPVALLSDEAFASFYFMPRADQGAHRAVSVIRSRDVRLITGSVIHQGDDTVRINARPVAARRYLLRLSDGDERQFWFSPTGDLLQVAVPSAGVVATRAEMPSR